MKVIVVNKPGGYSQLQIKEQSSEQNLDDGEVLVQVVNIGVNYADCLVRLGLYKSADDHIQYRGVPGFDFSGEVQKIGSGVTSVKLGDRVFGAKLFGAYQTEVIVDEKYLFLIPEHIGFATAASLPTAFLTAFYIINNLAHIEREESLLVRSIAGGVGSWLAILGKRMGAEIFGTVSIRDKKRTLEDNGNKNIELSNGNEFNRKTFDVITNAYGGETIKKDFGKLKPRGRLILYGFHGMISTTRKGTLSISAWIRIAYKVFFMPKIHPFLLVNQNKSVSGCNLSYLFSKINLYRSAMGELIDILNENKEVLPIVTEIDFNEVAKAHYLLEHKNTIGKLVLKVS